MTGLWTRQEAAEYLGCSVRKFDSRIREHLTCYKVFGSPMFRKEDIDSWLVTRKVGGSSVAVASTAYVGVRKTRPDHAPKSPLEREILSKLRG